jgi:uncharacterized membrane protein YfbV (UPF0208 family)
MQEYTICFIIIYMVFLAIVSLLVDTIFDNDRYKAISFAIFNIVILILYFYGGR